MGGKRALDAQAAASQESTDDADRGRRRMAEAIKGCLPIRALCGPDEESDTLAIAGAGDVPEVQWAEIHEEAKPDLVVRVIQFDVTRLGGYTGRFPDTTSDLPGGVWV